MEPIRPNEYLRCESRRPRGAFALGLWKYSLAAVIVASAALDALWLVPLEQAQERDASGYHDAIRARCGHHHHYPHAPSRAGY